MSDRRKNEATDYINTELYKKDKVFVDKLSKLERQPASKTWTLRKSTHALDVGEDLIIWSLTKLFLRPFKGPCRASSKSWVPDDHLVTFRTWLGP